MTKDEPIRTIQITIKVFGGLREFLQGGALHQQMESPSTLAVLLQELKIRFPDLSEKLATGLEAGYLNILINGRNVHFLQGDETPLEDGDTVAFLPPVGGG